MAAVVALFTEDAIDMPANEPVVVGKEGIESESQSFLDAFAAQITVAQAEVEVAGSWAFARGTYAEAMTPRVGSVVVKYTGTYIWVLRRQPDGTWKVHREIYNSNNPIPGTGE